MTKTKEDEVAMTLRLPAELHLRLTNEARRLGISRAGYIRMTLVDMLGYSTMPKKADA